MISSVIRYDINKTSRRGVGRAVIIIIVYCVRYSCPIFRVENTFWLRVIYFSLGDGAGETVVPFIPPLTTRIVLKSHQKNGTTLVLLLDYINIVWRLCNNKLLTVVDDERYCARWWPWKIAWYNIIIKYT